MISLTAKQYGQLCEELVTNLAVDFFDDGEIDHVLNEINSCNPFLRQQVLALALALSHASSSLVPGLLRHVRAAAQTLSPDDLQQWLSEAFDLRDAEGIDQALSFLSRVDLDSLRAFQARVGLPLAEAAPLLETYLRALSGRTLKVLPDSEVYTDTVNICLPAILARCPDREDNLALYKLSAANAWSQIALGTLEIDLQTILGRFPGYPLDRPDLETFFDLFPERQLALDLYTVIESFRTEYFLMKELPGLMKQAEGIKQALYLERQRLSALSERSAFVEGMWHYYLAGKTQGAAGKRVTAALASLFGVQYESGPRESVRLLFEFYDAACSLRGDYVPRPAPLFIARIRPDKVAERLELLQAARRKSTEALIAKLISLPDLLLPPRSGRPGADHGPEIDPAREYLLIKGRLIEVDDELRSLIEERGRIPGGILVQGSEMGGESPLRLRNLMEEEQEETPDEAADGLLLDEWDYRRGGYRRAWCSLHEAEGPPGREPFVEQVLGRYSGSVSVIRKKFELLKRERGIKRRQKDGDEVDLDAVVASYSDLHAGISPSENLFMRIERQERNIAVLFLVDMSGSTQGWVNEAEKESLVLMSEALETLGDRYAVYGFSSMTRNQCDLYRIKGFDEAYGEIVKRRIAGIRPRDFTRMGAFIRRAAALLGAVDARTKLLITLSDSRPEDGDGYKGDYAVEDTRKALIEAGGQGIHPFCITIDREAQSYLPHLFGAVNYIFIDDVRKLPDRITEIYCRLTV